MIYIIAVHMEPSNAGDHEHIAEVQWREPSSGQIGRSDRQTMVDWINQGGDARVHDDQREVRVGVMDADPPYTRTYADGRYTNNLLSLPRY